MTLRVTWAYACDRCGALVEVSSDVQPMPLGWARVETLDMNGGMLQRRHLCDRCSPDLSLVDARRFSDVVPVIDRMASALMAASSELSLGSPVHAQLAAAAASAGYELLERWVRDADK